MCIMQKYNKLTTLHVWTNYKIVKFPINVTWRHNFAEE